MPDLRWFIEHPESIERFELAVVYVHPDTLAEQVFEGSVCAKTAQGSLALALLCFEVRQRRHRLRCEAREAWMQARDFPFQRYRSAQRSVARRVYRTLANGEHLLLEAPTGSGKSMATIFPALKYLQPQQQLFFLTNRTTGAEAALNSAGLVADASISECGATYCERKNVPNRWLACEPQDCGRCKRLFRARTVCG